MGNRGQAEYKKMKYHSGTFEYNYVNTFNMQENRNILI